MVNAAAERHPFPVPDSWLQEMIPLPVFDGTSGLLFAVIYY